MRDCCSDEKHDDESQDGVDTIMVCVDLSGCESGIDSVENAKTRESPTDTVNNVSRTSIGELVDDHTQEEGVDEWPYSKDPSFGCEVGLLNHRIGTDAKLGIDIARSEKHIGNNVDYFE